MTLYDYINNMSHTARMLWAESTPHEEDVLAFYATRGIDALLRGQILNAVSSWWVACQYAKAFKVRRAYRDAVTVHTFGSGYTGQMLVDALNEAAAVPQEEMH